MNHMLNTTISFLGAYGLGTKLIIFEIFWTCLILAQTSGMLTIIYPNLFLSFFYFFGSK